MLAPPRRRILGSLLAVALGACNATAKPPGLTPIPSSAPTSVATSSEPSAVAPASASPLAGQTDSDWGRIWDSLPADFPTYPGAVVSDEAETGPTSAVFVVPGAQAPEPMRIADFMRSKLEQALYRTESLSGPLEDGSFVLDSSGPAPGCRVQVSVAPLGQMTRLTVLYGGNCPQP